jgi:7,8-dihydropterin-6-yl-methyl-4-(beta-D-ribofuranosyl)aminobenzene 5'-phosphate synthase
VKNLNSNLTGVVGGFHLAGRSVEDKIDETIGCLRRLNPDILLAGHCTGWKAKVKLSQSFEYNFQPLSVGGRYIFNAM